MNKGFDSNFQEFYQVCHIHKECQRTHQLKYHKCNNQDENTSPNANPHKKFQHKLSKIIMNIVIYFDFIQYQNRQMFKKFQDGRFFLSSAKTDEKF